MNQNHITRGLDYYKATMSRVEHREIPDASVTFELKNRSKNQLSEFCSPSELRERLDDFKSGWQPEEVAYLAGLVNQVDGKAQFSADFLDYLADTELPPIEIGTDDTGELTVCTTGPSPIVTFWETVAMSEINEIYFQNKLTHEGISLESVYKEGDRRLDEKIARLKERPDIKISDFGTRRRFSWTWQKHVIERLAAELPDNLVGTSNIYLAHTTGLKPIGTFAHELPMIYAALAEGRGEMPLLGHNQVLQDWQTTYRGDLSTALTDTFGTDFFELDFTREQMLNWDALRHDSGDPFEFGERMIDMYRRHEIDPQDKSIVFSDGLNIDTIIDLADYFKGKINTMYGWGTSLTNDLGLKPNNFVMKAVAANGVPTVKLSDSAGKHTGPETSVNAYKNHVALVRNLGATTWQQLRQNHNRELVGA